MSEKIQIFTTFEQQREVYSRLDEVARERFEEFWKSVGVLSDEQIEEIKKDQK
jgi:predicted CoA-binding protein